MKHPTISTTKVLAVILTGLLAVLPACATGLSTVTAGAMPEISQISVSVQPGGTTGTPAAATPVFGPASAPAPNPAQSGATGMSVQIAVQTRNFNVVSPTGATGTPGATTPATTTPASPTATRTATPTATVSPTATTAATGTPGATATATRPATPTATAATATPGATATGAAAAASGHLHYFIDTTVPTTPGVPALTQPGTVVQTTATTFTWTNVMPGTHIFSVQLVNSNHTPLIPLVIATAIVTIPAGGATATPGATTPATPTATATAAPTATVSPTATTAATGTPGATATATRPATPTATAATGTPGATATGQNAQIWQVTCQLGAAGTPGATATATPAATAAASGRAVTFSVQTRNVTTSRYAYFMDVMIPTDPTVQATAAAGTFQASSATSVNWANVMPGAHAFSVELLDADGTPMAPLVEATIIITVPGATGTASGVGTPGATVPSSTATMSPTPSF